MTCDIFRWASVTGRLAFRLFSPKKELWSLRPTVQIPLSLLRVNEHIFLRISFDTSEFSGLYSVNLTDASGCLLVEINETGSKVHIFSTQIASQNTPKPIYCFKNLIMSTSIP